MKAISLWEPWGTAIALGLKQYETRSWSTPYRGLLAIHCARTTLHANFILIPEVAAYFREKGILRADQLSFGKIVAVARLVNVVRTEVIRDSLSAMERAFGDYTTGRFAWKLEGVLPLAVPLPWRGQQGFFEVPDDLTSFDEHQA